MRASPHRCSGALGSAGAAVRVASAVLLFMSAAEAWVAPAFLGNTALVSSSRRNGLVLRLWPGEAAVCVRARPVGMVFREDPTIGGKQADRRRSTVLSSIAPPGRSAGGKQGGDAQPGIPGSERVAGSRAGGSARFPQLVSFNDAGKLLEANAPFLTKDSKGRYPITGCVSLALGENPDGINAGTLREIVTARRGRINTRGG